MADQKISAMPTAATLTGAELVPLVQSGANVKATLSAIKAVLRTYGGFSDTNNQTGDITQGTAISFDTIDVNDGVTVQNSSEITVPTTGIYNLQFSIQFENVGNSQHDATVWLRINGSDLENSSTQYTIPARKSAGIYGYNVTMLTFLLELNANDYVEIFWVPESTEVSIQAKPASVSPAYPAIPSIIAVMLQVG